jgi:hypothetical protein
MATQHIATRQLTDKQAAFVAALIETGDAPTAAQLAGFLDRPSKEAWRLLRIPHVLAAVNAAVQIALAEDAPLARYLLRRYVKDESMNPKIRMDAARTLLDRAGHIAPKARDANGEQHKPLNELTVGRFGRGADAPQSDAESNFRFAPSVCDQRLLLL